MSPNQQAAETQERLKSSLAYEGGSFSQVVAVTQTAINDNLFNFFAAEPDMTKAFVDNGPYGKLDATISAGEVNIPGKGSNLGTFQFVCKFEKGKLQIPDFKKQRLSDPYDMTDWKFVFDVKIGNINLAKHDKVYKDIVQQHPPGDYTITRLYLDFHEDDISNFLYHESTFGDNKLSQDQASELGRMVRSWFSTKIIQPNKKPTVGYAVTTTTPNKANEQAPTFPPTSLKLQTYPYIAPGKAAGTDGAGQNMLLYIEMTEHLPMPEAVLNHRGNFAASKMDGSICISANNFWDKYLLRRASGELPALLRAFNEATFVWNKDVSVDIIPIPNTPYKIPIISTTAGIGSGSDLDSDPGFYDWKKVDGTPLSWSWEYPTEKSYNHGWKDVFDYGGSVKSTTKNTMSTRPGSNTIHLSGVSELHADCYDHTAGIRKSYWCVNSPDTISLSHSGLTIPARANAKMTWSCDAVMKSVNDDQLQIDLQLPENLHDGFKFDFTNGHKGGLGENTALSKLVKSSLENKLKADGINTARDHLATALKTTSKFVFPGKGTFLIKNPMFNNHGDLMAELTYNGVH